jgi:uncharacterized protein YndB with AHSA1/START domain
MTYTFDLTTGASPHAVWAALTTPQRTAGYLAGLTACSTWQPGSAVTFTAGGGLPPQAATTLVGEVLAAAEPARLSYTVTAGPGQPATYVAWEITAEGDGAVVRLSVDDPELLTAGALEPEAEEVWAGVIAGLGALLAAAEQRAG